MSEANEIKDDIETLSEGIDKWGKSVDAISARQQMRQQREEIEAARDDETYPLRKRGLELSNAILEQEALRRRERLELAGRAMQGLMANPKLADQWIIRSEAENKTVAVVIAESSLEFADALIAALAAPSEGEGT